MEEGGRNIVGHDSGIACAGGSTGRRERRCMPQMSGIFCYIRVQTERDLCLFFAPRTLD